MPSFSAAAGEAWHRVARGSARAPGAASAEAEGAKEAEEEENLEEERRRH